MVNTNALRGLIVSKGLTQEKVAAHLGITPKTFGTRMKRGVFGSDEIEAMIELLDIEDPVQIFFAKKEDEKEKTEFQEWRSTMAKLDNKLRKAEERRKVKK